MNDNDSTNVVVLDVSTTCDLPRQRILDGAALNDVQDVVLLGYTPDGEFYLAMQKHGAAELLLLLERARAHILREIGVM